jgi:glycyl-tRNA synthetase
MKWYEFWKENRMKWHRALGLGEKNYRFHNHLNLAHYANAACDIQFNFPMGFKELEGIHSRTDFDLKSHEQFSGKKLQYFDPETNQSFIPYVVETSIGLDRMFLAILSHSYREEKLEAAEGKEEGTERVVLSIPAALAPNKVAVLPLVKKDGLPEKAEAVLRDLKFDFRCYYEDKDTIGRRYRRMDAIGTPFCVTIDHQTLQDDTVTLRDRDTMKQERIKIAALNSIIREAVSIPELLKKI